MDKIWTKCRVKSVIPRVFAFFVVFGQNWTELDRIGQNWTELDRIGQNWTELDRIG